LEFVIELHRVPSIGTIGEIRTREEVVHEIQAFLDPFRHASITKNLQVMNETITRYLIELVRIYTNLVALPSQIKVRKITLIPNGL